MKIRFLLICPAIALFFVYSAMTAYWQKFDGPYGGAVRGLEKVNQTIFLITTTNGMFSLNKQGEKWKKVDLGRNINSLNFIKFSNQNIYLCTSGNGILISKDSGSSWQSLSDSAVYPSSGFIDPGTDGKIIISDSIGKPIRSTDSGNSWHSFDLGTPGSKCLKVVSNIKGEKIAAFQYFLYSSTDEGLSWKMCDTTTKYGTVNSIFTDKTGNFFLCSSKGLFRTTDLGNSWEALNNGLYQQQAYSFYEGENSEYYCGAFNNIYRSTDKGAEWMPFCNDSPILSANAWVEAWQDVFIVSTSQYGIYLTSDKGQEWNEYNQGFNNHGFIKILSLDKNNLLVNTGNKNLFLSKNKGESWTNVLIGQTLSAMALSPWGDIYLSSGMGGVYQSKNKGETFDQYYSNFNKSITSFAFELEGNIYGAKGNVTVSTDKGQTWAYQSTGLTGKQCSSLHFNSMGDLYAMTSDSGVFVKQFRDTLWYKRPGFPYSKKGRCLLISSNNVIYAGTDSSGILKSEDWGYTWFPSSVKHPIFTMKRNSSNRWIAAARSGAIFFSGDQGVNWTELPIDFSSSNINDVDITEDNYIIVAAGNGVYISTLPTSADESNGKQLASFSISPNPATDFIEISLSVVILSEAKNPEIKIYDVFGQEWNNPLTPFAKGELENSSSQNSLLNTQYSLRVDVSSLPSGLYFVRVGGRVGKFLKM